jgi:hypothetical protein
MVSLGGISICAFDLYHCVISAFYLRTLLCPVGIVINGNRGVSGLEWLERTATVNLAG